MKKHLTKTQIATIVIFFLMTGGSVVQIFFHFMDNGDFIVVLVNLFMIQQLILFHVPKK
jgi:hypothetical protein